MSWTVLSRHQNTVGNRKEEIIRASTDATSGALQSTLSWIENIEISQEVGTDRQCDVYPNSKTASAVQDDPGQFFVNNCAASTIYRFLLTGR